MDARDMSARKRAIAWEGTGAKIWVISRLTADFEAHATEATKALEFEVEALALQNIALTLEKGKDRELVKALREGLALVRDELGRMQSIADVADFESINDVFATTAHFVEGGFPISKSEIEGEKK